MKITYKNNKLMLEQDEKWNLKFNNNKIILNEADDFGDAIRAYEDNFNKTTPPSSKNDETSLMAPKSVWVKRYDFTEAFAGEKLAKKSIIEEILNSVSHLLEIRGNNTRWPLSVTILNTMANKRNNAESHNIAMEKLKNLLKLVGVNKSIPKSIEDYSPSGVGDEDNKIISTLFLSFLFKNKTYNEWINVDSQIVSIFKLFNSNVKGSLKNLYDLEADIDEYAKGFGKYLPYDSVLENSNILSIIRNVYSEKISMKNIMDFFNKLISQYKYFINNEADIKDKLSKINRLDAYDVVKDAFKNGIKTTYKYSKKYEDMLDNIIKIINDNILGMVDSSNKFNLNMIKNNSIKNIEKKIVDDIKKKLGMKIYVDVVHEVIVNMIKIAIKPHIPSADVSKTSRMNMYNLAKFYNNLNINTNIHIIPNKDTITRQIINPEILKNNEQESSNYKNAFDVFQEMDISIPLPSYIESLNYKFSFKSPQNINFFGDKNVSEEFNTFNTVIARYGKDNKEIIKNINVILNDLDRLYNSLNNVTLKNEFIEKYKNITLILSIVDISTNYNPIFNVISKNINNNDVGIMITDKGINNVKNEILQSFNDYASRSFQVIRDSYVNYNSSTFEELIHKVLFTTINYISSSETYKLNKETIKAFGVKTGIDATGEPDPKNNSKQTPKTGSPNENAVLRNILTTIAYKSKGNNLKDFFTDFANQIKHVLGGLVKTYEITSSDNEFNINLKNISAISGTKSNPIKIFNIKLNNTKKFNDFTEYETTIYCKKNYQTFKDGTSSEYWYMIYLAVFCKEILGEEFKMSSAGNSIHDLNKNVKKLLNNITQQDKGIWTDKNIKSISKTFWMTSKSTLRKYNESVVEIESKTRLTNELSDQALDSAIDRSLTPDQLKYNNFFISQIKTLLKHYGVKN